MKYFVLFLFSILYANIDVTLNDIEQKILHKEKGAYFCFCDEDFKFHDLWDQLEIQELIESTQPNILKSFDLSYATSKKFNHPNTPYSPLAASFLSTTHQNKCAPFLQFLQSQNILLVSDTEIPLSTRNLLFGSSCRFVSLADIESESFDNYPIVILSTCPEGKLIAKKLLERVEPFFLIDLGDLKMALSTWEFNVWAHWLKKQTSTLRILCTTAILPSQMQLREKFEERKQEYIKSLKILADYGYKDQCYIVESGGYTPLSFFEEHCSHVFYANTNDISYINKGVNEAKALTAALDYYKFDDDDIVMKLTGRYYFNNNDFLQFIEAHPEIDAFAGYFEDQTRGVQSGCFAMRCKYLKQMLQQLDLSKMEEKLIDIEWELTQFLKTMDKVHYVNKVGITAYVANTEMHLW